MEVLEDMESDSQIAGVVERDISVQKQSACQEINENLDMVHEVKI